MILQQQLVWDDTTMATAMLDLANIGWNRIDRDGDGGLSFTLDPAAVAQSLRDVAAHDIR